MLSLFVVVVVVAVASAFRIASPTPLFKQRNLQIARSQTFQDFRQPDTLRDMMNYLAESFWSVFALYSDNNPVETRYHPTMTKPLTLRDIRKRGRLSNWEKDELIEHFASSYGAYNAKAKSWESDEQQSMEEEENMLSEATIYLAGGVAQAFAPLDSKFSTKKIESKAMPKFHKPIPVSKLSSVLRQHPHHFDE
eukprot:gene28664-34606_t